MEDLEIRKAQKEDIEEIISLDHIALKDKERIDFIKRYVDISRIYVLLLDNLIIGYGAYNKECLGHMFINLIYIKEIYRNKGYGSMLISFIEDFAHTNKIFISTNESHYHMRHILEKAAYKESGYINDLEEGEKEIFYCKRKNS